MQISLKTSPKSNAPEINRSILASIKTSAKKLPAETVYNSYTGLGGLHGLDRKDFDSYNDYARAKKEFEMGQFFTPHDLCARMVALASPDPSEMVLDMCCGIGNFMNHLPNLYNAYGFDVDPDAVTVARYLYPQAHIDECDLRRYDPGFLFDLLLGNPPYNLYFDGCLSQLYFCRKACDLLNPGGLMLIVVPHLVHARRVLEQAPDKRDGNHVLVPRAGSSSGRCVRRVGRRKVRYENHGFPTEVGAYRNAAVRCGMLPLVRRTREKD